MWFEDASANGYIYNCYARDLCYQDNGFALEVGNEILHTTYQRESRMRY